MEQKTYLRVFIGNGAMFEHNKVSVAGFAGVDQLPIGDGLGSTIMFVEASQPVLWIQPDELPFDPNNLPALGLPGKNNFFAATADGFMRSVPKTIRPQNLRAAITANGGEPFGLE